MVALDPINKVVKLLATSPTAEEILAYCPSQEDQDRFDLLIEKKKSDGLSEDEAREADNFLMAEHMMRMAKLYALKKERVNAA